jgi:hypothetical protein
MTRILHHIKQIEATPVIVVMRRSEYPNGSGMKPNNHGGTIVKTLYKIWDLCFSATTLSDLRESPKRRSPKDCGDRRI